MKMTILTAVFNAKATIGDAIDSALAQTIPLNQREIVVVDDGSTDGTMEVLGKFGAAIRILHIPHSGLAAACNKGLYALTGDYFVRLDADDRLAPSACETLLEALEREKASCALGDWWEEEGPHRKLVRMEPFNLFRTIACGILFQTSRAREIGGYRPRIFEEFDFFLRYLPLGGPVAHVSKPLYHYRRHPGAMTTEPGYWDRGRKEILDEWGTELLARRGFWEVFPHE